MKSNNKYYEDINIDYKTIQSLPEHGSVINLLPQIQTEDSQHDDENEGDMISSTFIPSITPTLRKSTAINDTLNRMQNNDIPIMWPEIDNNPINEFQTPGYIARAFPTLYPYGKADLRSEQARDIKPAEYFKHLLCTKTVDLLNTHNEGISP